MTHVLNDSASRARNTFRACMLTLLAAVLGLSDASAAGPPIPFVKHWQHEADHVSLARVTISSTSDDLANEVSILRELFEQLAIPVEDAGLPIRLEDCRDQLPPAHIGLPRRYSQSGVPAEYQQRTACWFRAGRRSASSMAYRPCYS